MSTTLSLTNSIRNSLWINSIRNSSWINSIRNCITPSSSIIRLLQVFIIVKLLQLIIIYFTPIQFDTSSQLLLESNYQIDKLIYIETFPRFLQSIINSIISHIVEKLIVWDVVYFSDLFINDIKFEHQFVFCPLWWRLIKILTNSNNFYHVFILSLLINNACHLAGVLTLFKLTQLHFNQLLGRFFNTDKISYIASVSYILSPAAIFLMSSYSESISALLSFIGLYCREWSLNYQDFTLTKSSPYSIRNQLIYTLSGFIIALSYGFRANCLLLGIIYLYDLYIFIIKNHNKYDGLYSLIAGLFLFMALIIANLYPYYTFCYNCDDSPIWCQNTIPSLFQHAQSNYWNNGFLKYWTPNNIPNFIFALPIILISLISFKLFLIDYPITKMIPILLVNGVFLIGGVGFWHVQIINRIHTFNPIAYWTIAVLVQSNDFNSNKLIKVILYYLVIWNLIHSSLFSAFLPPA